MSPEVSVARLHVMRGMYLLNFGLVGSGVWSAFMLLYKRIWLLTMYLPLRTAGRSTDLAPGMVIGVVLDIIVIPWPYVVAHYVKKAGDRWR